MTVEPRTTWPAGLPTGTGRLESVDREFTMRVKRGYQKPEDFANLVISRGNDEAAKWLANHIILRNIAKDAKRGRVKVDYVGSIGQQVGL